MKTVNVNISNLFSGKCVGVDENGCEIKLSPAEIYNVLRTCIVSDAKYRNEVKSLNEKFMELIEQGGNL